MLHSGLLWQGAACVLPCYPDFLLANMAGLASNDSDDDFDKYLISDDEPD